MGTYCAPLFADSFLFCYEWGFMMSLSGDQQADTINALTLHPDSQMTFYNTKKIL